MYILAVYFSTPRDKRRRRDKKRKENAAFKGYTRGFFLDFEQFLVFSIEKV